MGLCETLAWSNDSIGAQVMLLFGLNGYVLVRNLGATIECEQSESNLNESLGSHKIWLTPTDSGNCSVSRGHIPRY